MRYFDSLPNTVTKDQNNNNVVVKNLLIRTQLLPQLSSNPLVYYKYSIQDGETPEIIADKYYGDSYRYWMVLYGNSNIMHPQFDWPLSNQEFGDYLIDKYSTAAGGANNVIPYTTSTVHHYEKVVTTVDNETQTTAIKILEVDANTYANVQTSIFTQSFPNGTSVTMTVSKNAVSIYNYEVNLNESKRNINIINSSYATALETQYKTLVNQ